MAIFLFLALWLTAVSIIVLEHFRSERQNYKVVHLTFRLALTFGIGAVIVAVVLALASLGRFPGLIPG